MLFCPTCANILLVNSNSAEMQFFCNTCPYIHPITQQFSSKVPLERKQVDDVLGGSDAWKNVDSTEVDCPACEHTRAYFMQIQIRSADEPMTTFYKCCECGERFRDG
eukprot:Lithocolla_globosa_v1_NODE_12301_length_439_cov_10.141388.p1 type:complete len:107 gc:universal NODE_12301_length_439_cov_10.141388:394-74(-)